MICLINPPQTQLREPAAYVPLGLAYLAAHTEAHVYNLAQGFRDIPQYDVYGITCHGATLPEVARITEYLKRTYPCKVIIGGPEATVNPGRVLTETGCDLVVRGEAELEIDGIIRNLESMNKDTNVIDCGYVENLDEVNLPSRVLFDPTTVINLTGIHGSVKPSTNVLSSRGCPYSCVFCCKGHDMFTRHRFHSAARVRKELLTLRRDYGIEHIRFVDDLFTCNKNRVIELCEAIKDLGFTFIMITRTNLLDAELLRHLKEAGCTQIDLGIESGSQKVLDAMNKGLTVEQNLACIKRIHAIGISVKAFLMYGFPGEDDEDREMTLDFLCKSMPETFTLSRYSPSQRCYFYNEDDSDWLDFKKKAQEIVDYRLSYTGKR